MQIALAFVVLLFASPGFCSSAISGNGVIKGNGSFANFPWPAPAASISVIQSTGRQEATGITTLSSTFTSQIPAGSYIFALSGSDSGAPTSVIDDSNGVNVYKQYVQYQGGARVLIYVASNTAAPTNWLKETYAGTGNRNISLIAVSGLTSSTGTVSVSSTVLNNAHIETTTMTLSGQNSITVCGFVSNTGGNITLTAGNGFTAQSQLGGSSTLQLFTETRIGSSDTPCDANTSFASDSYYVAGDVWSQ